MEELLHYVWKHKLFTLKPLQTTDGQPIEIIDPGLANMHAGPDFFNAKIKINDVTWVGNIEIQERDPVFLRHNHHLDPTYDSVILHVASDIDDNYSLNSTSLRIKVVTLISSTATNFSLRYGQSLHIHLLHLGVSNILHGSR